jgi:hypothetical protein
MAATGRLSGQVQERGQAYAQNVRGPESRKKTDLCTAMLARSLEVQIGRYTTTRQPAMSERTHTTGEPQAWHLASDRLGRLVNTDVAAVLKMVPIERRVILRLDASERRGH